ncbi:hypothetical protein FLL45_20920 [Aliikangiella marina]|uniref:Uncharacterized protein n=1 Tax=Aliikangiella marina TaxID=1712262 RepID=A0A545T349_9GAMM|nr:hypothetical protein [Aliikangiella marina]TQV71615.1 hypothetical protein FLL45_20920 [Aliikangiella marina]
MTKKVTQANIWWNEYTKEQYGWSLTIITVGLFGWFQIFNYVSEPAQFWFQRSGSIIVMLAAIAEVRVFSKIKRLETQVLISTLMADKIEHGLKAAGDVSKKAIEPWEKFGVILNLFWLLAGTIIWGYGDLIYSNI